MTTWKSISFLILGSVLCGYANAGDYGPQYARESVDVQNLQEFGTGVLTNGAVILTRDLQNWRLNADLTSTALVPGDAYSIWWVIFNFPRFCAEPYQCAGSDIAGSSRAWASAIWGGGFVADEFGDANTSLGLVRGKTRREVLSGTNVGLINIRRAEVHIVLRTHGPAGIAGPVANQIGTANDACPMEGCANKFFSVHRAVR